VRMATYEKYTLQLNSEKDAGVIAYLRRQRNKNDCIRQALIERMGKNRQRRPAEDDAGNSWGSDES